MVMSKPDMKASVPSTVSSKTAPTVTPGAPAHEDAQHADHDGQRHDQIDQEAVDRLIDHDVLFINRLKLHTDGQIDHQVRELASTPAPTSTMLASAKPDTPMVKARSPLW
jgi:hypothetical protein